MMFGYSHDFSGWGWLWMAIGMLLFWTLVFAAIIFLVRGVGPRDRTATPPPGPEQILAARFAQGEIDGAEYHDRLTALRRGPRPATRS